MNRFILTLGVAGISAAGCAQDRWQRVTFYDGYRPAYGTQVAYGYTSEDVRYDERFLPGSPSYVGYTGQGYDDHQGPGYRLTASQPQTIDEDFVRDVALGNKTEIELGQLALRSAASQEVKNFAQTLIDDHRQANAGLENAANSLNIDVPDELDDDHTHMVHQLQGVTGADFDRRFIDMMIADHRDDIARFESRASSPPANQVQSFAIQTLPKLRQHLQKAQDIQKRIGG